MTHTPNQPKEYNTVLGGQTPPYLRCQHELQDLLRSQYPLIFLRSAEESRAIKCAIAAHQAIVNSAELKDGELGQWSSIDGFLRRVAVTGSPGQANWQKMGSVSEDNTDPLVRALNVLQGRLKEQAASNTDSHHTYLLPDWSTLIEPNCHLIARQLKELVIDIDQRRPRPRMTIIVVGSDWSIPPILRNSVHIVDLPLPTADELHTNVFSIAVSKYGLPEEDAKRLSEQAQGMPLQAATQTAKLITTRSLWLRLPAASELLLEVKKQEIRKTGVLEYYAPQGKGLEDVGGLEEIKKWIFSRQSWFEQDSDPEMRPRAILLEGFPGCGKTFIARGIAQEWRVPQINFEISRLQSKWVGESESNTFQALRAIESSAPNILFMDEIEKAFAGVGGDSSGVSTRQFGTFLSWLNDHDYPIFFIATSNDRSKLPPELFRAGRFDEVFMIMPPNTKERTEIIQKRFMAYKIIQYIDHNPMIPASNLEFLIAQTAGYSGSELDKLVKEAIYLSGRGNLPTETHWRQALEQIKPQYRTPRMQELLQNYARLLKEGGGKPASAIEPGFIENLIVSSS